MFSSLVISLIIILIGGSGSGFVLYLNYWTVLISTTGNYVLLSLLSFPREQGEKRGGGGEVSKLLRGSELPAGLKPRQCLMLLEMSHIDINS